MQWQGMKGRITRLAFERSHSEAQMAELVDDGHDLRSGDDAEWNEDKHPVQDLFTALTYVALMHLDTKKRDNSCDSQEATRSSANTNI